MNQIFQYVKRKNGQRKGILYASKNLRELSRQQTVSIGFSLCNLNKDKFDSSLGLMIAVGRAANAAAKEESSVYIPTNIPSSIREDVLRFEKRCRAYFKIA